MWPFVPRTISRHLSARKEALWEIFGFSRDVFADTVCKSRNADDCSARVGEEGMVRSMDDDQRTQRDGLRYVVTPVLLESVSAAFGRRWRK
ncbi:unnamed protein product [Toxocara canis]|uniref:Transposase n=1 Tax=Toxocara canis TaxID=6265 RepID=A0A183UCC6_TOXCA|nr:unnamed protein product [Toxocara canis]